MNEQADVAVIIPTLRRPASLERALRSVMAQTGVTARLKEVVVVDNDPQASARETVERLAAETVLPILWRHAPQPGVATARNAGLAATIAPLIAFLDDDEAASSGWLSALVGAQASTRADAVFGPIRGRVPEGTGWSTPYLERFFGREGPAETSLIDTAYGCGNALLVRATALPGAAPSIQPPTRPVAKMTPSSPPWRHEAAVSDGLQTPGSMSLRRRTAPPCVTP